MIKRIPSSLSIFTRKNKRYYVYLPIPYNRPSLSRDHQTVAIINYCCLLFWSSRQNEDQIYSIVFKCISYITDRDGRISTPNVDPTFGYMLWSYQSTKWFAIISFQVVCGTRDFVATRQELVSWEESCHEMYAAKRTQKYSKDDKETVCFIMSHTHFRVNLQSIVGQMSRNFLLRADVISEV